MRSFPKLVSVQATYSDFKISIQYLDRAEKLKQHIKGEDEPKKVKEGGTSDKTEDDKESECLEG